MPASISRTPAVGTDPFYSPREANAAARRRARWRASHPATGSSYRAPFICKGISEKSAGDTRHVRFSSARSVSYVGPSWAQMHRPVGEKGALKARQRALRICAIGHVRSGQRQFASICVLATGSTGPTAGALASFGISLIPPAYPPCAGLRTSVRVPRDRPDGRKMSGTGIVRS